MFLSHRRLRLLALCGFFVFIGLWSWLPSRTASVVPIRHGVIVSLASSQHRLDRELPITLRSLVTQSTPVEIRLQFPVGEREAIERRVKAAPARSSWWSETTGRSAALSDPLLHPLVKIRYVEDVGPATKFVPVLRDLLDQADAGHEDTLNTPVIVLDDDHSYSPALVQTLLEAHTIFPNVSVGLRGWRVREDLSWGVPGEEVDRHVIHGYRLSEPYRVGVLTANEGYLVLPRFFLTPAARHSLVDAAPLLDTHALASTPAHLVDDIWMAGSLSARGVSRLVVPLRAAPSVDVTVVHTLETHMQHEGTDRGAANDATLRYFADAWRAEGLWYRFAADVRGAKGVVFDRDADEPIVIGTFARIYKEVGHWWREQMVKVGFQ